MMELQSSWVAQVLSGDVHLLSKEEMLAVAQQHYQCMEECGIPKHHIHHLHPNEFEYLDWLAAQVEVLLVEERLREIYWQVCKATSTPTGHTFRDEWVFPTQHSN
ncbi:hypothetical protein ACSBR2_004688 [Camellia fascicularis]